MLLRDCLLLWWPKEESVKKFENIMQTAQELNIPLKDALDMQKKIDFRLM